MQAKGALYGGTRETGLAVDCARCGFWFQIEAWGAPAAAGGSQN